MVAALNDPNWRMPGIPAEETDRVARAAAYNARWRSLSEALTDLDVARTEAEVLWGNEARSVVIPLKDHIGKLRWAISMHLDREVIDEQLSPEQRKEIRTTMFWGGKPDNFGDSVDQAVLSIENYVRPKIGN